MIYELYRIKLYKQRTAWPILGPVPRFNDLKPLIAAGEQRNVR